MKKIGFANSMYTLWDTTEKNVFVKNISKDIDTVKRLYPGVEIDMDLRGHHSFEYNPKTATDTSVFTFGQYKGQKISECTDYEYMVWYYNETNFEDSKSIIKKTLTETAGYHEVYGNLLSPGQYEEYIERKTKVENIKSYIEKNGYLDTMLTYNPNEDGYVADQTRMTIFKFDEVKQSYYNGFLYYMPIINGKAKRLKNKNIRVYVDAIIECNDSYITLHVNGVDILK